MKIMLETTVWPDDTPNHVYLFNDSLSHAFAYVRAGTKEVFKFKKPMSIDRRGRTFVELEDSEPEPQNPEVIEVEGQSHIVEVKGSKGNTYWVDTEAMTCSCPGFSFRSTCKHLEQLSVSTSILLQKRLDT